MRNECDGTFDDCCMCGIYPQCPRCKKHAVGPVPTFLGDRETLQCVSCHKIIRLRVPLEVRGQVYHTVLNGYSVAECNWAKGEIVTEEDE